MYVRVRVIVHVHMHVHKRADVSTRERVESVDIYVDTFAYPEVGGGHNANYAVCSQPHTFSIICTCKHII